MHRLLLCVTAVCLICSPSALAAERDNMYGLKFVSHEDIKDNRTSLLLTPEEALRLDGDFSLSFDVRFRDALHTFGYVFRLIAGEEANLDMVSEISADAPKLMFIEGQRTVAEFPLTAAGTEAVYDRWIHVGVGVNRGRGEIIFSVDSLRQSVPISAGYSHYRVWFGACDHPGFYTTDVPPMTLRDVKIHAGMGAGDGSGGGGKLLIHWRLSEHDGDTSYDMAGKYPARATNPVWLIDGYAHWRRRLSATVPEGYLNMASHADGNRIYFAAGNRLAVYDYSSADPSFRIAETRNRLPFTFKPNQIIFDDTNGRLVAYEMEMRRTSSLDPDDMRWSEAVAAEPFPRYWHHNAAFLPASGNIVTFGGYGEHTYKARMNVIAPDGAWKSFDLSEKLPPRYLSGMAVDGEGRLLVTGGYGNRSGLQSEGPHNLYDIWRIDPATGTAEQVGELDRDKNDEHFVFGRDMVMSEDGKTAYALIYSDKRYNTEIVLVGIDLATGRMTRYADAVPYRFSDIESFCTLVYDRNSSEFLLVMMRLTDGGKQTLLEIHSLESPPLGIADTTQAPRRNTRFWWWLAALLLAGAGGVMILSRRRRETPVRVADSAPAPATIDYHKTYRVEKRPSSILLLGGFQVVDRNGRDITGNFTQTMRALFLLILLETYKNGRGISSGRLKDILWFDKDPDNARNNRNVNIHKLRGLLSEVGDVDISGENSYWQLKLGEGVFCDYGTLLDVCREAGTGSGHQRLDALIGLASLGKLLPNTQTEWADAYKSDFSIRLIEQLMQIAAGESVSADPHTLLRIADSILVHDNLDEEAIRMKCTALVRMGKRNQAKQVYDAFVADFKKVLDSSPDFVFTDIPV